jgi:hypothetical protein
MMMVQLDHTNLQLFHNLANIFSQLFTTLSIVANPTLKEKIDQFYKDVQFLESKGFTHTIIGDKLPGVGKSNFSKYFNQVIPITDEFLLKFNQAWGEELAKNTDYEKGKADSTEENIIEEPKKEYPRRNIMHTILEKLIEGQNSIIKTNIILAESNKILAETNQKLFDRLPEKPSLPQNPPNPSGE